MSRRGAAKIPANRQASQSRSDDLLRRRDLIIFLASVVLFHFGNAAMLPMAGQFWRKRIRERTRLHYQPALLPLSS